MSEALLSIQNLRVDFPGVVAVNDLSFELRAGDVCALIGPNGAGKTTTLRAAAGLQEPTRGRVLVAGHDLASEPRDVKRLLGFVPYFSPVYDLLTTAEFLDHFARAYQVPQRSARVDECLTRTSLMEKRDAPCEGLSRGMKQRLMLAKALLHNPPVLLLDEPASGLDPHGRIEMRNLLLQLRADHHTILISSHILSELAEFCNRVVIMERGRLVRDGLISDLGNAPGVRTWLVKWRPPDDPARPVLAAAPGIARVQPIPHGALFDLTGGEDALDALLRQLVAQGVRITEWRSRDGDLEQIFLQSGAKELM